MTHFIEKLTPAYEKLRNGKHCFELLRDDRPYEVGDTIIYQEVNPTENILTAEEMEFGIIDYLRNATGLKTGYCILAVSPIMAPDK